MFTKLSPEFVINAPEILGKKASGQFFQLNALENRVFDVELEDESHVIVKFYRPNRWSRSQILAEHQLTLAAHEQGLSVVAPILFDGNSLHEKDGMMFALYPKIRGRLESELSEPMLKNLGELLGKIHQLSRKKKLTDRPPLNIKRYIEDSLAKIYKSSYVPKHLISRLEQTYKSALDFCLNHYKPQEVFLIHGDCHVGNILWQQDKPFLIDFDDSVIGPPVQDIWLVTGGDPEESFKKKDWLLSSYENFSAFDPQSLALLPSLKVMRQICFSGWIAERYDEEAFKRIFPLFSQDKYWFEEIQNIELHLNP